MSGFLCYMLTQCRCVYFHFQFTCTRRLNNRRWYIKIWNYKMEIHQNYNNNFQKKKKIFSFYSTFSSLNVRFHFGHNMEVVILQTTVWSMDYGNLMVSRKSFSPSIRSFSHSLSLADLSVPMIWNRMHNEKYEEPYMIRDSCILFERIIYGRWTLRMLNHQHKMVE